MTTYKWEPFDEDIKSMIEKTVIRRPLVESEEDLARQDIEDHEPSQWVKNLEESAVVDEADL